MLNRLFNKNRKNSEQDAASNGLASFAPTTKAVDKANHVVGVDAINPRTQANSIRPDDSQNVEMESDDQEDNKKPPVIGILGAKGGVGATSIAVNLAVALSMSGAKTTLVDSNLQQPDAAQLLGTEPEHSIMELLHRMPFPDRQLYDACCGQIETGALTGAPTGNHLNLLSPPLDGESGLQANLSQLSDCLKIIRCYADAWVIDLPRHLDKHLVNLTDVCDKILLVFEPTVAGMAACRRWLNTFRDLGYDKQRIICVINRAGAKYGAVEQQLKNCFADETVLRLPNASAAIWDCSARGIPLLIALPNHAYSRAMFKLAQQLDNEFVKTGSTNISEESGGINARAQRPIDALDASSGLAAETSAPTMRGNYV